MRAVRQVLIVLAVLAIAGAAAYLYFHRNPAASPIAQATPCPQTNELAGIEGYAPGAGGAQTQGRTVGSMGGGLGGALSGGDAATPSPQPAGTCPPVPQRDPLLSDLDALAAAIPKENFDVTERAKTLRTADASYAFVRNGVTLDDYAGALRGARGALIASAANADDKALLLAALLQAQGETVRFARSTLSDAEAATLAAAAATPPSPQPIPTTNPALLQALHVSDADLKTGANTTVTTASAALDDAVKLAASRADALLAELQRGGVRLSPQPAPAYDHTHYYVQVQRGGSWTDADPMPGLDFGKHLGAADAAFNAPSLPDDRYAAVTFAVKVTHADGSSSYALSVTRTSADLASVPIHLFVSPDGSNALAKAAKSTNCTPALRIGGRRKRATRSIWRRPAAPR